MIFVGGAPVPAFENLDDSFRLVRMPGQQRARANLSKTKDRAIRLFMG
jgi:hypothetical protein